MNGFFWGAAAALMAIYLFQPPRSFWGMVAALLALAVGIAVINIVKEWWE